MYLFFPSRLETKEERIAGRTVVNVTVKRVVVAGTEVVVTSLGQSRQACNCYSTNGYVSSPVSREGDMGSYYYKSKDELTEDFNREGYDHIVENKFLKVSIIRSPLFPLMWMQLLTAMFAGS
jgi:hypothetical protein